MKSFVLLCLLVLGLIGVADATYLSIQHHRGVPVVCEIGTASFGNCEDVLASQYATVAGIPVSLAGVAYYLVVFVLLIAYVQTGRSRLLDGVALLTGLGFLATLWFVYLQLFVLNAICFYCMISAASTTLLFIGSAMLARRARLLERAQNPSR